MIQSKTEQDIYFMRLALREAELAFSSGEVPVGVVLTDSSGNVLSSAHNKRETLQDPTAHAEILALRQASELVRSWRLTGLALYATKEPCIMCAGALINARIDRLIYGCDDPGRGAVSSIYKVLSDKRLNHRVEVTKGVLEDECASLLRRFFKLRR